MNNTATDWQAQAREEFHSLLGGIASALAAEKEHVERAARASARDDFAESLNQGLRRLRQTARFEDAAALALELAVPFAPRSAVFTFSEGAAHALASHGLGEDPIEFTPEDAAAFRAAIESRDPVIAIATDGELSPLLSGRVTQSSRDPETAERVYLFPLAVRGQVKAVLFAAGEAQPAVLELLAGIAAMHIETVSAPPAPKREDLFAIHPLPHDGHGASAAGSDDRAKRLAWTELSSADQALHLRAQRFARTRAAQIRLEHAGAVRQGLAGGDLYRTLREPIDLARREFQRDFMSASPTMVDYLYLELVRSLAQDDDHAFGPDFPGPLVFTS